MLGIKCFGNLEHYCFEKHDISDVFGKFVTSLMMSYKIKGSFKFWLMTS